MTVPELLHAEPVLVPRRRVAEADLADRLLLRERSRRLVPTAVALRHVRRRTARRWDAEPELREAARRRMEAVVAGTHRAAEVEELARAAVLEDAAFAELFLRPWKLQERRRVEGVEHLAAAIAEGRGVVVSYCHLGPFQTASSSVLRAGRRPWLFIGPWIAAEPAAGDDGRLLERWRAASTRSGARLVLTGRNATAQGEQLLRRGEVVCLLFDLPGQTETQWLGKPVALATGTARMAHAAGALVVPMHCWRSGPNAYSAFLPSVDARESASAEELHLTLAATHERLVLVRPEALESPLRGGSWMEGARPERWSHPGVLGAPSAPRGPDRRLSSPAP